MSAALVTTDNNEDIYVTRLGDGDFWVVAIDDDDNVVRLRLTPRDVERLSEAFHTEPGEQP